MMKTTESLDHLQSREVHGFSPGVDQTIKKELLSRQFLIKHITIIKSPVERSCTVVVKELGDEDWCSPGGGLGYI